jgi:hypothetical protein
MAGFAAQVADWVNEVEGAAEAIFKESVQELVATAQSRVPVDTGYMKNSLLGSTAMMPPIDPKAAPVAGSAHPYTGTEISAVISGLELGQTLWLGYTAAYAARLEYGFNGIDSLGRVYNQKPLGFVRLAAQDWTNIVQRQSQRLSASLAFS